MSALFLAVNLTVITSSVAVTWYAIMKTRARNKQVRRFHEAFEKIRLAEADFEDHLKFVWEVMHNEHN